MYYVYYVKVFKGIVAAGPPGQTGDLTEWYNGTANIKNNKVLAVNSTGAMCFGSGCSGQIFFNGTAMVIRVV